MNDCYLKNTRIALLRFHNDYYHHDYHCYYHDYHCYYCMKTMSLPTGDGTICDRQSPPSATV